MQGSGIASPNLCQGGEFKKIHYKNLIFKFDSFIYILKKRIPSVSRQMEFFLSPLLGGAGGGFLSTLR